MRGVGTCELIGSLEIVLRLLDPALPAGSFHLLITSQLTPEILVDWYFECPAALQKTESPHSFQSDKEKVMKLQPLVAPCTAQIPCKRRRNADYRCATDWSHPCSAIWGADGNRLRTRRLHGSLAFSGANFLSFLRNRRRVILYTVPCVPGHNEVN